MAGDSARGLKWLKRICLGAAALAVLSAGIGAGYQGVASRRDAESFPPPGKMVDVGGYRLHILCKGEGAPPVVFDAGRGDMGLIWAPVQDRIATTTKACIYDRAGYGWSDYGAVPRTSDLLARELAALIDGAGLTQPLVLVSHSLSGLQHRMFANLYPDRLAGMVFVDVSHETQRARFGLPTNFVEQASKIRNCAWLNRFGWKRIFGDPRPLTQYAAEYRETVNALLLRPKWCAAIADEVEVYADNIRLLTEARDLGDIPIVVMTATDKAKQYEPEEKARRVGIWLDLQKDLLSMSTVSRHIITDQSSHYIQVSEPELVISEIEALIGRVRGD